MNLKKYYSRREAARLSILHEGFSPLDLSHSASKSRKCSDMYYRLDIHHSFCPHSASKSRKCSNVYYRLDIHPKFCPNSASKSRKCSDVYYTLFLFLGALVVYINTVDSYVLLTGCSEAARATRLRGPLHF